MVLGVPSRRTWVVFASFVAVALFLAGCESSGYKKAESTQRGLEATRAELTAVKADITKANDALNDLVSAPKPDLRPQFEAYASAVKTLQKDVMRTRDRAIDMRSKREAYVEAWRQEVQKIQSQEMREQAMKRMEATREQFEKLGAKLNDAKEIFVPFMADLEDIQRYLHHDLSPGGVASIKDTAADVKKDEGTVQKKIDELIAELDRVSKEIAPAQTPPPAAATESKK